MFKLLKFLLKLLIIAIVVVALIFLVARLPLGPLSNVAKTAEVELMQIFDQNATTKYAAQKLIDSETKALAKAMDVTEEKASEMLSTIDFAGWTATELPANAVTTKTVSGNLLGIDGSITLYSDNSYLTVSANSKNVTLTVPSEAKRAVSYLYWL